MKFIAAVMCLFLIGCGGSNSAPSKLSVATTVPGKPHPQLAKARQSIKERCVLTVKPRKTLSWIGTGSAMQDDAEIVNRFTEPDEIDPLDIETLERLWRASATDPSGLIAYLDYMCSTYVR
jgi:hypothetical protein